MSDRERHRIAARDALSRSQGSAVLTAIPKEWWNNWRKWVDNDSSEAPGPVQNAAGAQFAAKSDEMVWIPTELFRTFTGLYGTSDVNTTELPQAMLLTNSKWNFSWSYAEKESCWNCGETVAPHRCAGCHWACYCGDRCQKIHWDAVHHIQCIELAYQPDEALIDQFRLRRKQPRGLINLGNSCFMNATIQCLVAARPLLKYFLRDEWRADLHPKHRNVAVAYAELCKHLAFSEMDFVNPSNFKAAVATLSSGLFAGYQQNDAEEFLLFLLDTLHEDLDVVRDKGPPPRENEDQWFSHRRREHSIVDSMTLGSYETQTTCSKCGHASTKTDVFKHLNLALPPNSNERVIVVMVVRQPLHANLKNLPQRALQTRYAVLVNKDGRCEQFQKEVASASKVPFERLWFVSVERGTLIREIQPSLYLRDVPAPSLSGDVMVVAYELGEGMASSARSAKGNGMDDMHARKAGRDDIEMKADDDDDRHLICMFSRGKRVEKVIPVCVSFSASNDTVRDIVSRLKEVIARQTKDTQISFFLSNAAGQYDESQGRLLEGDSTLLVDFTKNDAFKTGRLRMEFIVCVRTPSAGSLKIHFIDHDSCIRLKAQLANELKGESVLSCLHHFVQPSVLDEQNCWRCPKCSLVAPARQTVCFTRLPDILILVLKRFDNMQGKLFSLVRFDVDHMDLSEFIAGDDFREESQLYDLFGVVNHYGSMIGGHYTAYIGTDVSDMQPASRWEEIDDSKRTDLTKEKVVSSGAYILFYRKRRHA